jgi:hypothetical protein
MYLGHEQIYPNTTTVTSFAFADTSTVSNAGATRVLNIGGDVGSTFNLTGANGAGSLGAQSLSSSSQAFNISIGSNNSYGAAGRSPSVTISPTGNTILASGLPTTRTLTQAAGPSVTNYSANGTIAVTTLVNNTTVVNGALKWANGAKFRVTYTASGTNNTPWAALGGYTSFQIRGIAYGGSGQTTATLSNIQTTNVPMSIQPNNSNLYWFVWPTGSTTPSSQSGNAMGTGYVYQADFEITNSNHPSYIQWYVIMATGTGYTVNGDTTPLISNLVNDYP